MNVIMPVTVSEFSFGGWFFTLTVCGLFEEEKAAPLAREIIRELIDVLDAAGGVDLQMPDFGPWDIVAEAPLIWRGHTFEVVANTSDGAVFVQNPKREPLDDLLATIAEAIHIA
jgi:hypothetical protein